MCRRKGKAVRGKQSKLSYCNLVAYELTQWFSKWGASPCCGTYILIFFFLSMGKMVLSESLLSSFRTRDEMFLICYWSYAEQDIKITILLTVYGRGFLRVDSRKAATSLRAMRSFLVNWPSLRIHRGLLSILCCRCWTPGNRTSRSRSYNSNNKKNKHVSDIGDFSCACLCSSASYSFKESRPWVITPVNSVSLRASISNQWIVSSEFAHHAPPLRSSSSSEPWKPQGTHMYILCTCIEIHIYVSLHFTYI